MKESLGKQELDGALAALGARVRNRTEILIGGAGALILTGELPRATSDCDVLFSKPDMGQLQEDIRAVAEQKNITSGWLNGSVQSYLDVLPPDFRTRLRTLPSQGKLQISVLHRRDVLVMKFFAGRLRDLKDIEALRPTVEELQFVRNEIPRLSRIDTERAKRIEQLLDQRRDEKR